MVTLTPGLSPLMNYRERLFLQPASLFLRQFIASLSCALACSDDFVVLCFLLLGGRFHH